MSMSLKNCALRRSVLLLIGLLTMSLTTFAQITVTGTVTDETGETLIGATVMVKGTSMGVNTDLDGNFTLNNVPSDGILTVSYVGYEPQEVEVKGRTTINVMMMNDTQSLDEVVVIGYGSLSRRELSSSIVQVSKDDFQVGAMNNPMEMLTGKVAGLNVTSDASANPNASSSLQVRGATSLSAGNGPLVVIDGIAGGDIRNLSPQDIESMTVLKDAASAAIYGTRGANGVILVTTRRGNAGGEGASITYDGYISLAFAKNKPEVLTADEFRRSRRQADFGYNTDWYDLITRDYSYDTNHYLAIDGNTANGSYSGSISYKKANGLDIVSGREEYGLRFSLQQSALDRRLQFTTSLSTRRVNEKWGDDGMFDTALGFNPTMPVYNEDGSYYQPTSPTNIKNPVQQLKVNTSQGRRVYVLGNADLKWNVWSNDYNRVYTNLSYAIQYNDLKSDYYTPTTSGESFWGGYKGRASIQYQKWWTNMLEWTGNYQFTNDEHDAKVLVGYTFERSSWEQMFMENKGFDYDSLLWHGIGTGSFLKDGLANMYAGKSESTLIGFFGRVNYNWRNLLMASASLRYEGSTKFGADHKWGAFPSASLAWEMTNMSFMEDLTDKIQTLKPRVSYGVTGRSDFDSYKSISTYSSNSSYKFPDGWQTGFRPSNNANSQLGWEKLVSANVGVDFMLFNRLGGSIEYFDRRSQDLLYNYTAPQPPYIYSDILVNVGTTKNTGIEIALDYDVFNDTPVKWTTGVNYSWGTTKLTKLSNDIYKASYLDLYLLPGVGTNTYFFRVEEGNKIAQYYGYKYCGVNESGDIMVLNKDNEPILATQANPEDKRVIGNGAPEHFLTWSNDIKYKNWDLSLMFNGAFGFDIYNMRKYGMGLRGSGQANVLRTAYTKDKNVYVSSGVISSYFLERGDYFKLQNVTLGYTVPLKRGSLVQSLRLYVAAKNLFTITGYSGNDPSIVNQNGITPGIDTASSYPESTSVTFGVTLRFK